MALAQYTVGTLVELAVLFKDEDGQPADPTAVTGEIIPPPGTGDPEALNVVRRGVGDYYALYTPTLNGLHLYRFAGTGDVEAASESAFTAQTMFPTES